MPSKIYCENYPEYFRNNCNFLMAKLEYSVKRYKEAAIVMNKRPAILTIAYPCRKSIETTPSLPFSRM